MEDHSTFFVPELTITNEGEDTFFVSSPYTDEYYELPEVAIHILNHLREGKSIGEIDNEINNADDQETLDIKDFIAFLLEESIIFSNHDAFDSYVKNHRKNKSMSVDIDIIDFVSKAKPKLKLVFSIVFFPTALFSIYCIIQSPNIIPGPHAFYFQEHLALSLFLLITLYFFSATVHELGHIFFAALKGVKTRFGISNRLWFIVFEADISEAMLLPKKERYLPIFGGMIMDIFSIAIAIIVTWFMIRYNAPEFLIQVFKAWILQIVISMLWQCNVFIRTDLYFALCNYLNCQNMDFETRQFIRFKLHQLSRGLFFRNTIKPDDNSEGKTIYIFSFIWFTGRLLAIFFLLFIVIPSLLHYVNDVFNSHRFADGWRNSLDVILYLSISFGALLTGLYMWIRNRPTNE